MYGGLRVEGGGAKQPTCKETLPEITITHPDAGEVGVVIEGLRGGSDDGHSELAIGEQDHTAQPNTAHLWGRGTWFVGVVKQHRNHAVQ